MPNVFTSKLTKNGGTSAVQVGGYTPGAGATATVIGLTLANTSAAAISASAFLRRGGVDHYVVKDAPVPVGGALVAVGGNQKIVMEPGDAIYVQSSAATSLDAIMSVLEVS